MVYARLHAIEPMPIAEAIAEVTAEKVHEPVGCNNIINAYAVSYVAVLDWLWRLEKRSYHSLFPICPYPSIHDMYNILPAHHTHISVVMYPLFHANPSPYQY